MASRAITFNPTSSLDTDLFGTVRDVDASRRADFEATRRPIRDYADLIPEPGFGPLDFERFPYLVEPFYSDEVAQAPEVVYVKSTQIGATTGMWRWAAREAHQYGRTVIYNFPTQTDVNEFGDERIEPAIEGSKLLREAIPAHFVHTKRQKRIGRGWLYLRGAKSRSAAQSVAAQSIVFDEYDELTPAIVVQFERRLSGAKQSGKPPRVRRLGIPRLPGGPMDREWKASDRREWIVTCPSCGLEQPVSWEENVRWTMPGDAYVDEETGEPIVFRPGGDIEHLDDPKIIGDVWRACRECDESIEGRPLLDGRWVAQNPGHPVIGFYIHRLIVADTDLHAIVVASRKTAPHELEAFYNNDLGRPYSPAEASLDEETIKAAASYGLAEALGSYGGTNPVTAGIDVHSEKNLFVRVSEQVGNGQRRALWIGEVRNFGELKDLLLRFRVTMSVIDGMPERRLARALASDPQLTGRVVIAAYTESAWEAKSEPEALAFDPKRNLVTLHRTMAIDAMMDAFRHVRTIPLRKLPRGYVDHLQAPKRRTEYDSKGRARRVYESTGPNSGADHYAHAEVYDLAATELWRLRIAVQHQRDQAEQPGGGYGIRTPNLSGDELDDTYDPGFGGGL